MAMMRLHMTIQTKDRGEKEKDVFRKEIAIALLSEGPVCYTGKSLLKFELNIQINQGPLYCMFLKRMFGSETLSLLAIKEAKTVSGHQKNKTG